MAFALIKTEGLARGRETGHIFISHVAEDSSIAIQAAEALEAKGYSTWYYERDSVPGPAYLAQMGEAIDQCQADGADYLPPVGGLQPGDHRGCQGA